MIDRLNGVEPPKNIENIKKPKQVQRPGRGDSIDVSKEARALSEVHLALEAVHAAPDVREDRVAEVAAKLKDPGYITEAIKSIVADRLMDAYGI